MTRDHSSAIVRTWGTAPLYPTKRKLGAWGSWSGFGVGCGRGGSGGAFADFEAGEATNGDVFAELGDGGVDHLADGLSFVFDVVLFLEAALLVELFHFALDDFLDDLFGLAGGAGLRGVDFALAFEHFGSDVLAADVTGIDGGNVHGEVVTKALESFGARDEVAFTIELDDHADFSAGMNVVSDETFGGFARSLFGRGGLTFFAQDVDGLFDVAAGFDEGGAAIAEAGIGAFTKFLYELGWDIHDWFAGAHPYFLSFSVMCCKFLVKRNRSFANRRENLETAAGLANSPCATQVAQLKPGTTNPSAARFRKAGPTC
jgi:hypothetical protein